MNVAVLNPFRLLIVPAAGAVLAVAAWVVAVPSAQAAPQALGLIASATPEPMTCRYGECVVTLSSFCLEQHRRAPVEGTAYTPAPGTRVTLILHGADGVERRVDAPAHAAIESGRHYTTVRVRLAQDTLDGLGAVAASVEVAPRATLIPVPTFRAGPAHSEIEVAALSGPVREAASAYFDAPDGAGATARLLGHLMNELPAHGRASPDWRHAAWERAAARGGAGGLAPAAIEAARQAADECEAMIDAGRLASDRTCVEWRHREMQIDRNKAFWDSLGGS